MPARPAPSDLDGDHVRGRDGPAEVVGARGYATHPGAGGRGRPLPTSAWDLDALRTAYDAWQRSAPDLVRHHLGAHADPGEAAFAAEAERLRPEADRFVQRCLTS